MNQYFYLYDILSFSAKFGFWILKPSLKIFAHIQMKNNNLVNVYTELTGNQEVKYTNFPK